MGPSSPPIRCRTEIINRSDEPEDLPPQPTVVETERPKTNILGVCDLSIIQVEFFRGSPCPHHRSSGPGGVVMTGSQELLDFRGSLQRVCLDPDGDAISEVLQHRHQDWTWGPTQNILSLPTMNASSGHNSLLKTWPHPLFILISYQDVPTTSSSSLSAVRPIKLDEVISQKGFSMRQREVIYYLGQWPLTTACLWGAKHLVVWRNRCSEAQP